MIKLNLLIISEKFDKGGLETQINTIYETLKNSNDLYFAFANYGNKNLLNGAKVYTDFCFSSKSTIKEFVNDVNNLIRIIKENKIDAIIANPFYCVFPAMIAANQTKTKIFYVAHGYSSINFCAFPNSFILYEFGIEKIFRKIFAVNEDLMLELNKIKNNISVFFPNIIDGKKYLKNKVVSNKKWALVSRLDDDKYLEIINLLNDVEKLDISEIDIYGDGNKRNELLALIQEKKLENKVKLCGHSDNICKDLNGKYNGIIGIGRVVIESMCMGYPTMLIGYGKNIGIIDEKIYNDLKLHNFVVESYGINISSEELNRQLMKVNKNPSDYDFRSEILHDFSIDFINTIIVDEIKKAKCIESYALNKAYKRIESINHDDFANEIFYTTKNIYYILREELASKMISTLNRNLIISADLVYYSDSTLGYLIDQNKSGIEKQQRKLKETDKQIKHQQEELVKQQEEFTKQQEELTKQQEELTKEQEELLKQQEETINKIRKDNSDLKREVVELKEENAKLNKMINEIYNRTIIDIMFKRKKGKNE